MVKGTRKEHAESSSEASVTFFLLLTTEVSDKKQTVSRRGREHLPGWSECLPFSGFFEILFHTH